jgi:hypothetical protein
MFEGKKEIEVALAALAEQLEAEGASVIELVVCGGAALNILGYVRRPTQDVDIVAFIKKNDDGVGSLVKADYLTPELKTAAQRVERDFNLEKGWLNVDPASVMDFGFPEGMMSRLQTHRYGNNLIVHFLSRYDQIHFKLYAALTSDRRIIHVGDLIALNPTKDKINAAAGWIMTRDTTLVYKHALKDLLKQIGYQDVADKL